MTDSGWKSCRRDSDGGILLFAQKGAYSRIGVYVVHASILVIFFGAIIGELSGFKGSVMLPETQQTEKIYPFSTGEAIDLGFTVRCDSFTIEFYPNGMPKDYRSELTVLENGKELFRTPIEVNSPMTHRGVTFYQASYEGYNDFIVKVTNIISGSSRTTIVPFQEKGKWLQEGVSFGVINAEGTGQSISRMKMWFSDGVGEPAQFWLQAGESVTVERKRGKYLVTAKQMYATGLQVCKDPGVWIVYAGCGLMLLGLLIAFFLSHKRIWVFLKAEGERTSVFLVGSANKNRLGFEKTFNALAETLQQE